MRAAPLLIVLASACDKPAAVVIDAAASATAATTPSASSSAKARKLAMPERPIPKPQNTVGSGTSDEVQMLAITYMTAMSAPQSDDAPVDATWEKTFVDQLTPINRSMDKGAADAKARLNHVEIDSGGRRINLLMASGCDAQTPARAAQNASTSLDALLGHGVLVVRCNDARYQCLQNTRDSEDVLCTTAPRH